MHDNRQNDRDHDRDHDPPEPCSTASDQNNNTTTTTSTNDSYCDKRDSLSPSLFRQSPRSSTSPTPYLTYGGGTTSCTRASPLRQALSSPTPPASSTSTATPLLKASLNCPPVAHNGLLVPERDGSPSSTSSPGLQQARTNGSVDLSLSSRKRRIIEISTTNPTTGSPPKSPVPDGKRSSQGGTNPEMYSNLLMQLRQQNTQQPGNRSPFGSSSAAKMSAAARKEKLKCQTCFQCPVCKKRFQRHIAMNAHFQNEHIGQAHAEKVCLLCSYKAKDVQAIRTHLNEDHHINLDNPSSCRVEPESGVSITTVAAVSPVRSETYSCPSLNVTSSQGIGSSYSYSSLPPSPTKSTDRSFFSQTSRDRSLSPEQAPSPTPNQQRNGEGSNDGVPVLAISPQAIQERLEALSNEIKMESRDDENHAKDLRVFRQGSFHDKSGAVIVRKIQVPSANSKVEPIPRTGPSSIPIITLSSTGNAKSSGAKDASPPGTQPWSCQHCTIIFPNQTLYFLHRGFHSEGNPWRCNGCRTQCTDMYDFNAHLVSDRHH